MKHHSRYVVPIFPKAACMGSVQYQHSVVLKPHFCSGCRMWFCWKIHKHLWEKMWPWRQCFSALTSFSESTDTISYNLDADSSLDGPFPLHSRSHGTIFSKEKLSTVWWSILDASEPRDVDAAFVQGQLETSLCTSCSNFRLPSWLSPATIAWWFCLTHQQRWSQLTELRWTSWRRWPRDSKK